jgi:hypothetical protein
MASGWEVIRNRHRGNSVDAKFAPWDVDLFSLLEQWDEWLSSLCVSRDKGELDNYEMSSS